MSATALPKPGRINDRSFYVEYKDKPIRMTGASWVEPQGAVVVFDDFLVDVLADDPYVTVTQSGTPTTAAAVSATAGSTGFAGHGGWLLGSVDNVDAEIDEVVIGPGINGAGWMFPSRAGQGVIVSEFGFVIPTALTARQYFVGVSDDPTEGTTTNGPLNIQTGVTLVVVADDAAGFIFSSLATGPTLYKGASSLATVASTLLTLDPVITAVVDCYTVCRVEVDSSGACYLYASISSAATVGRKAPAYVGKTSNGLTPTVALTPYFSAAATTTTAVEWEIDYAFGACAR